MRPFISPLDDENGRELLEHVLQRVSSISSRLRHAVKISQPCREPRGHCQSHASGPNPSRHPAPIVNNRASSPSPTHQRNRLRHMRNQWQLEACDIRQPWYVGDQQPDLQRPGATRRREHCYVS
ncbi:hypothetical protein OG21DRAFT_1312890 [Imleria badia]|nr:hypothetical protein OG21DRAFT_1312890 [Imleria badia]